MRGIVVDHQHGLPARGRARLRGVGLVALLLWHDGRKTQREGGALAGRALDHDVATEQTAEGPRDGEAEAGAAELAGGRLVGLREPFEQPAQLLLRHADPRVDDPELQHLGVAFVVAADLQGQLPVLGEFRCVAQEVEEALPQLDDVGLHRADIGCDLDLERVALLPDQRLHGALDFGDQSRDLDPFRIGVHSPGFDLGEIENIVDEAQEVAGVGFDLAEIPQQARFAKVLDLLLHHLAVADDGGERGPELMAHIGQEGALGPVGGFGRVLGALSLFLQGFRLLDGGRERHLTAHQGRVRLVERREVSLVVAERAAQRGANQDHGGADGHELDQRRDLSAAETRFVAGSDEEETREGRGTRGSDEAGTTAERGGDDEERREIEQERRRIEVQEQADDRHGADEHHDRAVPHPKRGSPTRQKSQEFLHGPSCHVALASPGRPGGISIG